jgi:hypothetical protein
MIGRRDAVRQNSASPTPRATAHSSALATKSFLTYSLSVRDLGKRGAIARTLNGRRICCCMVFVAGQIRVQGNSKNFGFLITLWKVVLRRESLMSRSKSLLTANLLKLTPVVSLAVFCAATAGPLRAEDKLDKKVVELCKKVGDFYKDAKSLHTEGVFVTKIDNNGQKREINVAAAYEIERPNRLSLKTQFNGDATKGPDVISDGKKLTVYRKALHQYVQEDAPKDVSELGARILQVGPAMVGMLFPNVLNDDPADSLMQGVNSCSYVGMDKVDGTPAHHMKFSQDQFDWEMWVASEGKPFILQMTRKIDGENGKATTTETYKKWTVDAPAGKDSFTFAPPKDATKVDEFKEEN